MVTMTTLQIAEVCGKAHKHVLDDVRNMLISLENLMAENPAMRFDQGIEKSSYTSRGREWEMYILDRRMTIALVSAYRLDLRLSIIDRLDHLERRMAQEAPVAIMDPREWSISQSDNFMRQLLENESSQLNEAIDARVESLVTRILDQRSPTEHVSQPIENLDELMNPSQLGFLSRLSGQRVNRILIDLNFQIRDEFGYTPTLQAEGLFEEVYRRRNQAGRLVTKFLWKRRILQLIPARYLT